MMDELLNELHPLVAHETQRASEQYGDSTGAHKSVRTQDNQRKIKNY